MRREYARRGGWRADRGARRTRGIERRADATMGGLLRGCMGLIFAWRIAKRAAIEYRSF